jgi:hypothetical protein
MHAGHVFNGRVSFDNVQAFEPGTLVPLPEPHQSLPRWCSRCWRLIRPGRCAFSYDTFDLCVRCHTTVYISGVFRECLTVPFKR